jgi:hypothetical protein
LIEEEERRNMNEAAIAVFRIVTDLATLNL